MTQRNQWQCPFIVVSYQDIINLKQKLDNQRLYWQQSFKKENNFIFIFHFGLKCVVAQNHCWTQANKIVKREKILAFTVESEILAIGNKILDS